MRVSRSRCRSRDLCSASIRLECQDYSERDLRALWHDSGWQRTLRPQRHQHAVLGKSACGQRHEVAPASDFVSMHGDQRRQRLFNGPLQEIASLFQGKAVDRSQEPLLRRDTLNAGTEGLRIGLLSEPDVYLRFLVHSLAACPLLKLNAGIPAT